jgi:glycosyltransferase involved in cell wall biosynthesis
VVNCKNPGCNFEIIVVNNNSVDNTHEKVTEFITTNKHHNIRLYNEKKQGLSHARNLGIKEAKGDLLFFLDDDAMIDPQCIQRLCFYYERKGFTCMGGKILPWYKGPQGRKMPFWFSRSHWGTLSFLDRGEKICQVFYPQYPYGANWAVQRKLFEKYGPLNTNMGRRGKNLISNEEHEFMLRLEAGGEPIYYIPDAVVYHLFQEERVKLSYFIRRHFAQGISDFWMFNRINGKYRDYSQLTKRILELGMAPSKFLARKLARREDWSIPLFRIVYNVGFFWSIFGFNCKS